MKYSTGQPYIITFNWKVMFFFVFLSNMSEVSKQCQYRQKKSKIHFKILLQQQIWVALKYCTQRPQNNNFQPIL